MKSIRFWWNFAVLWPFLFFHYRGKQSLFAVSILSFFPFFWLKKRASLANVKPGNQWLQNSPLSRIGSAFFF